MKKTKRGLEVSTTLKDGSVLIEIFKGDGKEFPPYPIVEYRHNGIKISKNEYSKLLKLAN